MYVGNCPMGTNAGAVTQPIGESLVDKVVRRAIESALSELGKTSQPSCQAFSTSPT